MITLFSLIDRTDLFAQIANSPLDIHFNHSIGLVNIPTANLLKHGGLRASLNAGIFSVGLFDYFEMGLLAFNSNGDFYYGNRLAIKLIDEEEGYPAIAIGAESATINPYLSGAQYFNSYYVVMSKELFGLGTIHLGKGDGRFVGTSEVGSQANGFFFGIEKTFFEDTRNPFTVMLEEDGRGINFGMRLCVIPGMNMVFSADKLDNVLYRRPAPNDQIECMVGIIVQTKLEPLNPRQAK